ncbi:MAG: ankyrin repeat domain-containing protein [Chloracidobacterium sp.]|nr:ankyrin repeat domain-containing protein [Chloracidobacterium sp.]
MTDTNSANPGPTCPLPERANLEHLRKEAKQRLKTMRLDDPDASLAAAQLATARQYGFTSWRRLVAHVTALYEDEFLDAVKRGDTPAVAGLLRGRRKLARFAGEYGKTCLHWAAETDQAEIARLLLDAGADIEAKTSWGATPLEWAATMGSVHVAELLLSRGAGGFTLVTAAGLGKLEEVKAIIESGVDLSVHRRRCAPESPNDDWPADSAHIRGDVLSDAMYAAARNGHTQVVEYLLDRGAAVDAKGVFGATALHWAAINGHLKTILLLLARGASLAIRDARFNSTPEAWAKEGGHKEVVDVLHA